MRQIEPTHNAIQALRTYSGQHSEHEGALRSALLNLLAETARPREWTLISELGQRVRGANIYLAAAGKAILLSSSELPERTWQRLHGSPRP